MVCLELRDDEIEITYVMSITLCIVEDLDEVREGLQQFLLLNDAFHVIGAFGTAEEALRHLPVLSPDIVIMDINLPGISGIDCMRQVREHIPRTQFMMFTVYESDDNVFEALKAGASGYLLKSTSLPQLEGALKDLHNGGSPMNATIARKLVSMFRDSRIPNAPELSNRENEVLHWLSKGLLYKEIADKLNIST